MIDYHDWCHFCGALSSLPEIDIDIDILIIIESVFELPHDDIRICNECNSNLVQFHAMLLKSQNLQKMFKGLDEESIDDLTIVRLNAYRSHFQLSMLIADEDVEEEMENIEVVEECEESEVIEENDENRYENVEMDSVIYEEPVEEAEEIVEEYLEEEHEDCSYKIIMVQDFQKENVVEEKSMDDETTKNVSRPDYEKLFTFQCHLCDEPEFSKMTDLTVHCREIHNALPSVRCCSHDCGKMLSTWRRLIIHKERHFPSEEALKCHQCHRVFTTFIGLERHKKRHTTSYVCTYCARSFKEPKTLRWHEATHEKSIDERRNFECCHCSQKFITKQACQNHIGMKHEKIVSFFCKVVECRKGFFTKKALCEHQRTHGERKFKCNYCDFRAKTKSALTTHMDAHLNEKCFACDKCDMTFVSLRRLKCHMITHNDISPYSCEHCNAKFKRSKDLKNHVNTHNGVRAYSCNFCQRTFTNGSNCRKHKLKDHPEELKDYEAVHGSGRKMDCYSAS